MQDLGPVAVQIKRAMGLQAFVDEKLLISFIDRTRQQMALSQDGGAEEIGYKLRQITKYQDLVSQVLSLLNLIC